MILKKSKIGHLKGFDGDQNSQKNKVQTIFNIKNALAREPYLHGPKGYKIIYF